MATFEEWLKTVLEAVTKGQEAARLLVKTMEKLEDAIVLRGDLVHTAPIDWGDSGSEPTIEGPGED